MKINEILELSVMEQWELQRAMSTAFAAATAAAATVNPVASENPSAAAPTTITTTTTAASSAPSDNSPNAAPLLSNTQSERDPQLEKAPNVSTKGRTFGQINENTYTNENVHTGEPNTTTTHTNSESGQATSPSSIQPNKASDKKTVISSFPRPAGGYKYSMEFLYSIGRNMTGATMNISTPTSITPRSVRSSPPSQMMPPLIANMPTAPSSSTSGSSGRYSNVSANSYIYQAYMPAGGTQRRLWHAESQMWQYDRNYPYSHGVATTAFGIPGLVPVTYDAQYNSPRFIYQNYYNQSNYHHNIRHHQQQSAAQVPTPQPPPQPQPHLPAQVITTSITSITVSSQQSNDQSSNLPNNGQIQAEQLHQVTSNERLDARSVSSQHQQYNSAWRYGVRVGNRERYGSGRTNIGGGAITANGSTAALSNSFCESKSYYNSGPRFKQFEPTRSSQRNTNNSSNINNNNVIENICINQGNNCQMEGISKVNRNNAKNASAPTNKHNKKSMKGRSTNSSGSQSSISTKSQGSDKQRRSSEENLRVSTNTKMKAEGIRNYLPTGATVQLPSCSISNFRQYPNRSYRNRLRYNVDSDQQPLQTSYQSQPTQQAHSATGLTLNAAAYVLPPRNAFQTRSSKLADQRGALSKTSLNCSENGQEFRKSQTQQSRYYTSRHPEYYNYRNCINYHSTAPTSSSLSNQEHLFNQNCTDVSAASTLTNKMTSCDGLESFSMSHTHMEVDGSSTPVSSNDESEEPNSYPSREPASSSASSESSLSKDSIVSMVRAITYGCIAKATGSEMPNLSGPNLVPYGDMTMLQEHEENLRRQNGFKQHNKSVSIDYTLTEAAARSQICKCQSDTTSAVSLSSSERDDCLALTCCSSSSSVCAEKCSGDDFSSHKKSSTSDRNKELEYQIPNSMNMAFLHEFYGYTPADRFLARSHLVEVKSAPANLLNSSKWDILSQSVWDKFMEAQQTEKVYKLKMRLWRYIYIVTMAKYPRYGLYLVGSSISNFGTNASDIDMCMLACTNPNIDPRMEAVYHLQLMRECLNQTSEFEDFNLIEARVPILRFTDRAHKVEVDINFNNSVGIRNTHLLYCYSQIEWRVRPLVLVVKQWAQHHHINNAKNMTISSYSLVLMVIHFLQFGVQPPVLPCLHKMHPEKFTLLRPTDFGYVDMNEVMDAYDSSNSQSVGELILEFLRYFTFFDYSKYAISIRVGGVLPIEVCRAAKASKNDVHQWNELCIEEPFDQTNTARSVYDGDTFDRIKAIFATSWRRLEQTHCLHSIFEGYVGPSVVTPIESEGESDCFLSVVDESSSSGELILQKSKCSTLKQFNMNMVAQNRPKMVDKSVVALIQDINRNQGGNTHSNNSKTDINMSTALVDTAAKGIDAEVATNKTATVESVAEPLETIGLKQTTQL